MRLMRPASPRPPTAALGYLPPPSEDRERVPRLEPRLEPRLVCPWPERRDAGRRPCLAPSPLFGVQLAVPLASTAAWPTCSVALAAAWPTCCTAAPAAEPICWIAAPAAWPTCSFASPPVCPVPSPPRRP